MILHGEAIGRLGDRAAEDLLVAIELAEARALGRAFNFDEDFFIRLRDEVIYPKLLEIIDQVIERAP